MQKLIEKANLLIEALPYIKMFHGKTIVIKYGGAAMVDPLLKEQFAQDIVLMKYVGMNPVIVHGGGPQINRMMEKLGMKPRFLDGVRYTDIATLDIVEMVLGGSINKEIVSLINRHGGRAVGLTGKDGQLITAKKYTKNQNGEDVVDLGLVGEVEKIDPTIIENLEKSRFIPVIAPIGVGKDGVTYNINADWVAGEIAGALKAEKLLILTDVKGILNSKGELYSTLTRKEVKQLIKKGIITLGMLPKVESCLTSLERSVSKAHIIDGRVPHSILLEVFTNQGIGTEISP
ncbi:MAG: acetylglutamate kinase [Nitrospirae bacterium]|nr:acetylglutamate kinase [Nitrospirota bacterium]MBI3352999.1 acetylglutamate kinase [Nitrospirota bacterium]